MEVSEEVERLFLADTLPVDMSSRCRREEKELVFLVDMLPVECPIVEGIGEWLWFGACRLDESDVGACCFQGWRGYSG